MQEVQMGLPGPKVKQCTTVWSWSRDIHPLTASHLAPWHSLTLALRSQTHSIPRPLPFRPQSFRLWPSQTPVSALAPQTQLHGSITSPCSASSQLYTLSYLMAP